jgi:hypothetical protein
MMETLVGRLDRVERENRRLKLAGLVMLIGLAAVVLMGQVTPPKVTKVVEAEKFVLLDMNGKVRAELNMWPDGSPVLKLYSEDKKPRVALGVLPDDAPSLELFGKVGKARTLLTVEPTGRPLLALYGKDGKPMWSKP